MNKKSIFNLLNNVNESSANLGLRMMSILTFLALVIEKFTFSLNENIKFGILIFNTIIITFALILSTLYIVLTITKYIYHKKLIKKHMKDTEYSISIYMIFLVWLIQINAVSWILNRFVLNNNLIHLYVFSILLICISAIQWIYCFFYIKNVWIINKDKSNIHFIDLIVVLTGLCLPTLYSINLGDVISLWYFQILWIISFIAVIILYLSKIYKMIYSNYKSTENIIPIAIFTRPINLLFLGFAVSFNPNRLLFNSTIHHKSIIFEELNTKMTVLNNYVFYTVMMILIFVISLFTYIYCFALKWVNNKNNLKNPKFVWLTFPGSITSAFILRIDDYFFNNLILYSIVVAIALITYVLTFIDTMKLNVSNILKIKML